MLAGYCRCGLVRFQFDSKSATANCICPCHIANLVRWNGDVCMRHKQRWRRWRWDPRNVGRNLRDIRLRYVLFRHDEPDAHVQTDPDCAVEILHSELGNRDAPPAGLRVCVKTQNCHVFVAPAYRWALRELELSSHTDFLVPNSRGNKLQNQTASYPWLPPPDSSRTIEPTNPLASPKSIKVLSR